MKTTTFLAVLAITGWVLFLVTEVEHRVVKDNAREADHQAVLAATLSTAPIPHAQATDTERSVGAAGGSSLELVKAKAQVTALQQQYAALKDQMRAVEKEMVARGAPKPYEFDVSQAEWKDLAEEGHIKYRVPCWKPNWSLSDKDADKLGLSYEDQKTVMEAYKQSGERMLQMAYTLCGSFMDNKSAIYALGPEQCVTMAERIAEKAGVAEPSATAKKLVAEAKAGLQPAPITDPWIQRLVEAYTALANEGDAFQKDLEASLGPEDATRIWHEFPCDRTEQ